MAPVSLYSMLSDVLPAFIFFDTMRAGLFPTCGGASPGVSPHPIQENSGMNRLQEFLDNPHIITGTATVAAESATCLDRGEQGLLYACRGNRRVVPSTGQRPPSLDRTIFRRAPHRAPRRAPSPFRLGRGARPQGRHLHPHPPLRHAHGRRPPRRPVSRLPLRLYQISPAWRRCCAAPNTSAVNTPSSPIFPKICPLNTTLRRIPSPTPKSTIRSSGTNRLFPVSANGWAEARPSIP